MRIYAQGELGDQGSDAWLAIRGGKITASKASSLVSGTGKPSSSLAGYAAHLGKELYAGEPLSSFKGNKRTERGKELEPAARAAYEFENSVDLVQVDFIVGDNEATGCSPDSLIGDGGLYEGKALGTAGHLEAMEYFDKHGELDPKYRPQAHFQLWVAGRQFVDLHYWHPKLPAITQRIERSVKFDAAFAVQVAACLELRDAEAARLESIGNRIAEAA